VKLSYVSRPRSSTSAVVVLADGAPHVLVEIREVPIRIDLGHTVGRDEEGSLDRAEWRY
jgi:hypothetical protein